jgi:hypothetical protein
VHETWVRSNVEVGRACTDQRAPPSVEEKSSPLFLAESRPTAMQQPVPRQETPSSRPVPVGRGAVVDSAPASVGRAMTPPLTSMAF